MEHTKYHIKSYLRNHPWQSYNHHRFNETTKEDIKTFRELKDGIKCLLRADMMNTYYKHRDKDELREYEAQNFEMMYAAYKHLGGNSFIDKIHDDVKRWEVTS